MTRLDEIERMAHDIDRGEHKGDPSTYYSAMLELARFALRTLPVIRAAEAWRVADSNEEAFDIESTTATSIKARQDQWRTTDALRVAIDQLRSELSKGSCESTSRYRCNH